MTERWANFHVAAQRGVRAALWRSLRVLVWFAFAWSSGCQWVAGEFEVQRVPEATLDACNTGDFRCNGEYLLSCGADGSWMLDRPCASEDLCDSTGRLCQVCEPGDLRCDGAIRQECSLDGSRFEFEQECSSDAMCNPTFCGSCTPGEVQCRGAGDTVGRELWECGADGLWSVQLDTCATPGLCAASVDMAQTSPTWSRTCEMPGCTTAGEYVCDAMVLKRCRQDLTGWDTVDTCASVGLCELAVENSRTLGGVIDMCPAGCTSPGAFLCSGMNLQRCRDDLTGWDSIVECEPGTECNPVEGACTDFCNPGEFQCNGVELRRCRDDRAWELVEACAAPILCGTAFDTVLGWSGSCTPPVCPEAGAHRCDEFGVLSECRSDLLAWEPVETCASAALCSEIDRRCHMPACEADELRCFGDELRQCLPDRTGWMVQEVCEVGQYCDNTPGSSGCKLECPSPLRCNGRQLERCTPDGWEGEAACLTNELCSCALDGSCELGLGTNGCGVAVCGGTHAAHQCDGSVLERCQEGRNGWDVVDDCDSAALCYPGTGPLFAEGYCATCPVAGEVNCVTSASPAVLQTCAADRRSWTTTQTCSQQYGCMDSGTQDYCAICNTGQVQCSALTLQKCGTERRSWVNTACMSAALCDAAGGQCDICMPNSNSCAGMTLQHCSSDGQVVQSQDCANYCDAAHGECDGCLANTSRCANEVLYECAANGQSETPTTCATAALCDASAGECITPTCAASATRCLGAQPQVCNSNRNGWDNAGTACATAQLCRSGACLPPVCTVGQKRCSGAQPEVCNAARDAWDPLGSACVSAGLCSAGSCLPPACETGETRCFGAQPQICNGDRTAFVDRGALCASVPLCVAADGSCMPPACNLGDTRCTGAQPEICRGDRTGFQNARTACETAALCVPANGTCDPPACGAGERRCTGAQPELCNADRTAFQSDGPACATAALCRAGMCMTPGAERGAILRSST